MRNIILRDNDIIKLIAKVYIDGSVKFVKIRKIQQCRDEIFYLIPGELDILIAEA